MDKGHTVRQLARIAGVSVRTLHHYDSLGLLKTLDDTLMHYQGGPMLTDAELYQGFTAEKIAAIRKEARDLYGEKVVEQSERRVKSMGKEKWEAINRDVDEACREMAKLMTAGRETGEPPVQALAARHHAWIRNFWTPDADSYRGLGSMYRDHPEFRAYYERYAPGFGGYLCRAIDRYCAHFPIE